MGKEPRRDGPAGKVDQKVTIALAGYGEEAAPIFDIYLAANGLGSIKATFENSFFRVIAHETTPRRAEKGPRPKRWRMAEFAAVVM